jgi:hypothetical protein
VIFLSGLVWIFFQDSWIAVVAAKDLKCTFSDLALSCYMMLVPNFLLVTTCPCSKSTGTRLYLLTGEWHGSRRKCGKINGCHVTLVFMEFPTMLVVFLKPSKDKVSFYDLIFYISLISLQQNEVYSYEEALSLCVCLCFPCAGQL